MTDCDLTIDDATARDLVADGLERMFAAARDLPAGLNEASRYPHCSRVISLAL